MNIQFALHIVRLLNAKHFQGRVVLEERGLVSIETGGTEVLDEVFVLDDKSTLDSLMCHGRLYSAQATS
jgi:hypothetical protein